MDFRLLGPLEVVENRAAIDVGSAKPRALLAVLLLNANRVVSRDDLVDALWGERVAETASKALQVYVSQLRKSLGRDRIVTRALGYELRVEPGELDLEQFTLLVDNPAGSRRLFCSGAELRWRTLRTSPLPSPRSHGSTSSGLACLEQRIDEDPQRQDDTRRSLPSSGRSCGEHPLRERLREQYMLALYRSGRQAEALDTYQAGRMLLFRRVRVSSRALSLKELQRAILEHDPRLASPQPSPHEPISRRADEPAAAANVAGDTRARGAKDRDGAVLRPHGGRIQQLDPESLRALTARGFDELLAVLERYGATVERSLGGAAAAIFGIPLVHEDDALRAVRAAAEMRQRLAAIRPELEERWGAWLGSADRDRDRRSRRRR